MAHFADRLATAVRQKKTPALVGLDPRVANLPAGLLADDGRDDLAAVANAYSEFCRGVIDVVADRVPAVKPQAAFFEQLGPHGMNSLAATIDYAREKGLIVVLDGKRNDIGSTATAYAKAYLGRPPHSPWGADCLTVSPYLGDDSLTPFMDAAVPSGAGIFVLVKTSNPGGKLFQDLVADGKAIYQHVAAYVEKLSEQTKGDCGYGIAGAVVGATYPAQLDELRAAMPHTWFLVPGFGAQGGAAADVAGAFDEQGLGAIINSSRAIIFAHQREAYRDKFGDARWQDAVSAATDEMIQQLAEFTPAGRLR